MQFNKTAEDLRGLASSFTVLGIAYAALNNMEKALEYYESALNLQRSTQERRGEGITLNQIGSMYLSFGHYEKASDAYKLALQLWRNVKDQNGETITLFNIARLERDRGNLVAAHEQIQRAITIVESQRAALNSQRLVASYFASKQDYYELATDVAMSLGSTGKSDFVALALEISERARGRRLLDALAETRIIRESNNAKFGRVNPNLQVLVRRQSDLRTKLRAKANALTVLLSRKHTPDDELVVDKEIKEISDEYDEVEARIKALDPAYATLAKPRPLTAKEMQGQLDTDTLLLEYSLGDKRSYVWVVTNETIRGIELAPREQIESLATRLLHAVTARNREEANETPIQRQTRWANADKEFSEAAAALSKLVIGPVASMLGNGKRLVVVADGVLQLVPFSLLPEPATPNSASTLITQYEIVSLPSASVLALQRRKIANRKPAPLSVAVLADPVFDLKDQRVANAIAAAKQRRRHAPKRIPTMTRRKALPQFRKTRTPRSPLLCAA